MMVGPTAPDDDGQANRMRIPAATLSGVDGRGKKELVLSLSLSLLGWQKL